MAGTQFAVFRITYTPALNATAAIVWILIMAIMRGSGDEPKRLCEDQPLAFCGTRADGGRGANALSVPVLSRALTGPKNSFLPPSFCLNL